ncbi:MAG TPA: hypothetical protein VFD01_02490 [Candidatus Dormibacteraeota bacterium]|nr:hypothetical protein [Candidatus Dormibacteraeota bacterium]
MDAVIYCRSVDRESEVLREHLEDLGIDARMRNVDADPSALREWERLDGEVTPLLVLDRRSIVRGLDRTRVDQLVGWIGC